jgi:hypothetical protein
MNTKKIVHLQKDQLPLNQLTNESKLVETFNEF